LSRLETPTGTKVCADLLSLLVSPTVTKGPCPPLARLAVGPGTKATYCPEPKGCRDKWPETKTCSIVVEDLQDYVDASVYRAVEDNDPDRSVCSS